MVNILGHWFSRFLNSGPLPLQPARAEWRGEGGGTRGDRLEGNYYLHRKLLFTQEGIIYLGRRHARRQVGRKLFTYYYVNNFLPKKKRNYLRITNLRITNLHRKVSFTLGGSAWGQRLEGNWYLHRKLLFKQECIIYLGRKRVRTQVGRKLLFTYY